MGIDEARRPDSMLPGKMVEPAGRENASAGAQRTASLRDAVYGAAVGDALGVPYEFSERGSFLCTGMASGGAHGQAAGTWSDDTSMIIATCDSLRLRKRIDVSDLRKRFCSWMHHGAYTPDGRCFDIGNATATALEQGFGCSGERSNGNGSLMRIIPLAFCDADDSVVAAVSAITHAHRISTDACCIYVRIARDLAHGAETREALAACIDALPAASEPPFERLAHIGELPEDAIQSSGYVVHTLEASLWCLINTTSYEECVLRAVNLGLDTDTTACAAGGLAGIVYGRASIPAAWADMLRAQDVIESCLF